MKKLTAMQDLKEDLQLAIESANNALNDIDNEQTREQCQLVVKITIGNILKRIDNELLKLEKEQIVDGYVEGCKQTYGYDEPNTNPNYDRKEAQDYYNETFNQAKS